jgi:hypothetical protein
VEEAIATLEAADREVSGYGQVVFAGEAAEAAQLVDEFRRLYDDMMYELEIRSGQPTERAHEFIMRPAAQTNIERWQAMPADRVNWGMLVSLMHHDPALAVAQWIRIKSEALAEIQSGYAAAKAIETPLSRTPYARAQFLALRDMFRKDWQPQTGIEEILIDEMTEAFTLRRLWTSRYLLICEDNGWEEDDTDSKEEKQPSHDPKGRRGTWREPRVSRARAAEIAMQHVDRWDRVFYRAVRNLRDMRRFTPTPIAPPSVTIHNPAQVNVGQQQINVSPESEAMLPHR